MIIKRCVMGFYVRESGGIKGVIGVSVNLRIGEVFFG